MVDEIEKAYGSASNNVEHLLGRTVAPGDPDRAIIEPWAHTVSGPILDVGSGTGRWTGQLAGLGHDITGLEPVERLVHAAREAHPGVEFCRGSIQDLAQTHRVWAGILSWYSVIHLSPAELPAALAILRSVLQDEGTMLMSFFAGTHLAPFNHPVAPAYRWPMDDMTRVLADAGFEVTAQHWDPGAPHAWITARAILTR